MNIKPTRGYVLISPEKAEEKTASGLYLPDSAQEKPQKGTVIAIGMPSLESVKAFPNGIIQELTKGDKVYYKRWGGDEIKEDGKEYKLVKFEDILAVIE